MIVKWYLKNMSHTLSSITTYYKFTQPITPITFFHKETLELKPFLLPDLINIVSSYREPEIRLGNAESTDLSEEIALAFIKQGVQVTRKNDSKLKKRIRILTSYSSYSDLS